MINLPQDGNWRRDVAIGLGLLGLIMIGVGVFIWKSGSEPEMEIIQAVDEVKIETNLIFADIEGAVNKPGVYSLKEGERVVNLITAAGGYTEEANVNWVELHVNLAEIITDGYKLYIPKVNEDEVMGNAGNQVQGKVSVNYASQAELESLPGIGVVTAGKIIDGRLYSQLQELLDKKIVTTKVYEQIKELISL